MFQKTCRIRKNWGTSRRPGSHPGAGLGLGLAGQPGAGSLPADPAGHRRNSAVGPPSCWPTSRRKTREGPVRCGRGGSHGRYFPTKKKQRVTAEGRKRKETSPVYNSIMEPKWSDTFCQRVLFTGFTLCVVLGECWSLLGLIFGLGCFSFPLRTEASLVSWVVHGRHLTTPYSLFTTRLCPFIRPHTYRRCLTWLKTSP